MRMVGTFEAKTHLVELLREVARGQIITITKRGEPVAMLSPVPTEKKLDRTTALEALKKLQGTLPKVSAEECRSWVEDGRQ